MWNDWHGEVRKSAAQCLGKTGHGRDVHDDLRARILEGNERIKLEAISKVGQLGKYNVYESTVKPVLSGHLKKDKTKVFKPCDSLMQVKSTAECSMGAFCNTFDLH